MSFQTTQVEQGQVNIRGLVKVVSRKAVPSALDTKISIALFKTSWIKLVLSFTGRMEEKEVGFVLEDFGEVRSLVVLVLVVVAAHQRTLVVTDGTGGE